MSRRKPSSPKKPFHLHELAGDRPSGLFRVARQVGPLSTEQMAWFDERSTLLAERLNGIVGGDFFEPQGPKNLRVELLSRENLRRIRSRYGKPVSEIEYEISRALPRAAFSYTNAGLRRPVVTPPRFLDPDYPDLAFVGIGLRYDTSQTETDALASYVSNIGCPPWTPGLARIGLLRSSAELKELPEALRGPMRGAITDGFPKGTSIPLQGVVFDYSAESVR